MNRLAPTLLVILLAFSSKAHGQEPAPEVVEQAERNGAIQRSRLADRKARDIERLDRLTLQAEQALRSIDGRRAALASVSRQLRAEARQLEQRFDALGRDESAERVEAFANIANVRLEAIESWLRTAGRTSRRGDARRGGGQRVDRELRNLSKELRTLLQREGISLEEPVPPVVALERVWDSRSRAANELRQDMLRPLTDLLIRAFAPARVSDVERSDRKLNAFVKASFEMIRDVARVEAMVREAALATWEQDLPRLLGPMTPDEGDRNRVSSRIRARVARDLDAWRALEVRIEEEAAGFGLRLSRRGDQRMGVSETARRLAQLRGQLGRLEPETRRRIQLAERLIADRRLEAVESLLEAELENTDARARTLAAALLDRVRLEREVHEVEIEVHRQPRLDRALRLIDQATGRKSGNENRIEALQALSGEEGGWPVEAISPLLEAEDRDLRAAAIRAVAAEGSLDAVALLIGRMGEKDAELRDLVNSEIERLRIWHDKRIELLKWLQTARESERRLGGR